MKRWQVVLGSLRQERVYLVSLVLILGVCSALAGAALAFNRILFFQDLPYPEPAELFELRVALVREGREVTGATPPAAEWVKRTVPGVGTSGFASSYGLQLKTADQDLRIRGSAVAPEYLAMLAPEIVAGQGFAGREAQGGDIESAALISERLQQRLYPSAEEALGQLVTVNDQTVEIIGVVGRSFRSPIELAGVPQDLWIGQRPNAENPASWQGFSSNTQVLVRASTDELARQVEERAGAAIVQQLRLHSRGLLDDGQAVAVRLVPLRQAIIGDSDRVGFAFLAAAAAIVGLGLSFASFLVISRLGRMRSALSLHLVLGARRGHLAQLIGFEQVLILLLTSALGLILGALVIGFIRELGSGSVARVAELDFGSGFAVVVFAMAVATLLVLAVPMVRLLTQKDRLLSGSGGFKGAIPSPKLTGRSILLTVQTALTAAGVAIGLIAALDTVPRLLMPEGFRSADRYFVQVQLPRHLRSAAAKDDLMPTLVSALRGAGFTSASPVDLPPVSSAVALFGAEDVHTSEIVPMQINGTDEVLFGSLELPLLAGTGFSREQYEQQEPVMVVGETLARWLGGTEAVLGKLLRHEEQAFRVIGVVGDVRNPVVEIPGSENQAYVPYKNYNGVPVLSFVTSVGDGQAPPEDPAVVRAVRAVDPQLFLGELRPLGQFRAELLRESKFKALLALAFICALLTLTVLCVRTMISDTYREMSPLLVSHWVVGAKRKDLRLLLSRRILRSTWIGVGVFCALGLLVALGFGGLEPAAKSLAIGGVVLASAVVAALTHAAGHLQSLTHVRSIFSAAGTARSAPAFGSEGPSQ